MSSTARRPTLLAVDDDEGVRESYACIFEGWADVVPADGGASAIEAARRQPFDAIILDVRMPGMSGIDAFGPLRAAQPHTPILFVSADDSAETALCAAELGAFAYVTKPFQLEALVAVVRRAVASALTDSASPPRS